MHPILHIEIEIKAPLDRLTELDEVGVTLCFNPWTRSPLEPFVPGEPPPPQSGDSGWLTLVYPVTDGAIGANPTSLTVGGAGEIPADFPLAELLNAATEQIRLRTDFSLDQLDRATQAAQTLYENQAPRNQGRPPLPEAHFNHIAVEYAALVKHGESRPAKVMASRHHVAYETMRRWIRGARKRGYIGEGVPGKAGWKAP